VALIFADLLGTPSCHAVVRHEGGSPEALEGVPVLRSKATAEDGKAAEPLATLSEALSKVEGCFHDDLFLVTTFTISAIST